jgi:hypothetical protein
MQKMYLHRPFMRPKVRHLGIYEKNTNYISCHVLLKVSFVLLFSVDCHREIAKNSIPLRLCSYIYTKSFS